jgi:hypothetical protein
VARCRRSRRSIPTRKTRTASRSCFPTVGISYSPCAATVSIGSASSSGRSIRRRSARS